MSNVAYVSPMVPPEWIAAHQLQPIWLRLARQPGQPLTAAQRGVCRCAALLVDQVLHDVETDAVVLTTICDQMRYAAALLREKSDLPVFLLNIPSTWQRESVRQLYRDELVRLGRFLEALGGQRPSGEELKIAMRHYDEARSAVRRNWPSASSCEYATTLAELRSSGRVPELSRDSSSPTTGVPLALVGGPLLEDDFATLELVARVGGRIVLDASEWGERTLPAPFDRQQMESDPLGQLCRAYFDEIPAVFRRPNTGLYQWLGQRMPERGVRGILFWRQLSCDLWHAELEQLRQWSHVPLLDIEASDGSRTSRARTQGRIEAFLEMLQ